MLFCSAPVHPPPLTTLLADSVKFAVLCLDIASSRICPYEKYMMELVSWTLITMDTFCFKEKNRRWGAYLPLSDICWIHPRSLAEMETSLPDNIARRQCGIHLHCCNVGSLLIYCKIQPAGAASLEENKLTAYSESVEWVINTQTLALTEFNHKVMSTSSLDSYSTLISQHSWMKLSPSRVQPVSLACEK